MSVLSEIERLEGAKSALAASITGKGVAVPDGTKIDGMAALVDQIPTGGGGGVTFEEKMVDLAKESGYGLDWTCAATLDAYPENVMTVGLKTYVPSTQGSGRMLITGSFCVVKTANGNFVGGTYIRCKSPYNDVYFVYVVANFVKSTKILRLKFYFSTEATDILGDMQSFAPGVNYLTWKEA